MSKTKQPTSTLLDKLMDNAGLNTQPKYSQSWDDLNNLYEAIGSQILAIGVQVNNAIKVIMSTGISNNTELKICIDGLRRDIEMYTKDLITIKSRHNDKSGNVKDGNELAFMLSIFEEYTGMQERIQANAFPVMLTITEHLSIALASNKTKAEEELTDPTVVSDIEVKEKLND